MGIFALVVPLQNLLQRSKMSLREAGGFPGFSLPGRCRTSDLPTDPQEMLSLLALQTLPTVVGSSEDVFACVSAAHLS